jgi:hypothetical protein
MADVEDNQENFEVCLQNCGTCPSYPGVEGQALYCARGPSDAEIARKGCHCPDCPVWVSCGLTRTYYCRK